MASSSADIGVSGPSLPELVEGVEGVRLPAELAEGVPPEADAEEVEVGAGVLLPDVVKVVYSRLLFTGGMTTMGLRAA